MISKNVIDLAIGVMNSQIEKLESAKIALLNNELKSLTASEHFAMRNGIARFQACEQIALEVALWGHHVVQHWSEAPVADKVVLLDLLRKLA